MAKKILTILVLFCWIKVSAQPAYNKDSLKKAFISEKNDSLKPWKHLDYIQSLLDTHEPAKNILKEIETLKKETSGSSNDELVLWVLYYESLARFDDNDYLNSIIAIEKLQQVAARSWLSEKARNLAVSSLITLGVNYSKLNDLENAQINYHKAITQLEAAKDSTGITHVYLNMGFLFMKAEDWLSAKRVFQKGLQYLSCKAGEKYAAPLYASLTIVCSKMNNQKDADFYLKLAANSKKSLNNAISANFYEQARGENEILKKNYLAAIDAFNTALSFARKWGDTSSVAEAYEGLGRAYWKLDNKYQALQSLILSKQLAEKHQLPDLEKIILKTLFGLYKTIGLKNEAIGTADSLLVLIENLTIKQNNNRRIIADALFESGRQMAQISTLQRENQLSNRRLKQKNIVAFILAGTAIAVLLISLLGYRNYRQKQKLQQQKITDLEKEKLLLATQSILKGREEERSRLAKDLHDGLGGLLSGVKLQLGAMKGNLILTEEHGRTFSNALSKLDESISEMRRVAHNMMPEALMRLGLQQALQDYCDGLSELQPFTINCEFHALEKRMPSSTEIVVYRIVQELLNNAVKHSGAKTILAQVIRQADNLSITVEDDGEGFDLSQTDVTKGAGLANVKARVDYLKGQMDIQSAPKKGTSVHIDCIIEYDG